MPSPIDRVKQLAHQKGWNQDQLARATGVHKSQVSKHFGGLRMTLQAMERYARALGVSREYLETGIERPSPQTISGLMERIELGPEALERVLQRYPWPSDMDISAMDEIQDQLRTEAKTPAGAKRAESIWLAALNILVRERGHEPSSPPGMTVSGQITRGPATPRKGARS